MNGQLPDAADDAVILGLGNLQRRDEGLSIRALWRLQQEYALPEAVRLVEAAARELRAWGYAVVPQARAVAMPVHASGR